MDRKPLLLMNLIALSALVTSSARAEDASGAGKALFGQSCAVCHGVDGHGVPHLGKDLVTSKFAIEKTDDQLLEFIRQGRLANDPLNTTGIPMPPRAGNPNLSDDQIRQIIGYLRTLESKK